MASIPEEKRIAAAKGKEVVQESTASKTPDSAPTPTQLASSQWWAAGLNTLVQEVATFITVVHPGFMVPSEVSTIIPIVAQLAAAAGWIWAMKNHKDITVAGIAAATVKKQ